LKSPITSAILRSAGETDAGSSGEQSAREIRPKARWNIARKSAPTATSPHHKVPETFPCLRKNHHPTHRFFQGPEKEKETHGEEETDDQRRSAGSGQSECFDRAMGDAPKEIKVRHIGNCMKADPAYGKGVAKALGISISKPQK
jgi:catalase